VRPGWRDVGAADDRTDSKHPKPAVVFAKRALQEDFEKACREREHRHRAEPSTRPETGSAHSNATSAHSNATTDKEKSSEPMAQVQATDVGDAAEQRRQEFVARLLRRIPRSRLRNPETFASISIAQLRSIEELLSREDRHDAERARRARIREEHKARGYT
jgi:hypothetical protein